MHACGSEDPIGTSRNVGQKFVILINCAFDEQSKLLNGQIASDTIKRYIEIIGIF